MLKKLFNKCILINKRYYKTIVLNIGPCPPAVRPRPPVRPPGPPRTRPVRRAPARSVRSRPSARLVRRAPDLVSLLPLI